jgi:predicted CoA-binding protein
MASNYETFFHFKRYAVVGHAAVKPFPKLTYKGLKKLGKEVFPIDPSAATIDGDATYPDLAALPAAVEALVIEVPKPETKDWVARAAAAGIKDVWIHMAHDTPEAQALAQAHGINLRTGTCAVMYLQPGFSPHGLHALIMKAMGKY